MAILRRRRTLKDLKGQLTLEESIRRMQEIKKKLEEETAKSKEIEEYTPIPEELEEPSLKNRMSVMNLFDTGESPETAKKTPKEKKFRKRNP